MVTKLRLTAEINDDETLASFVGRLGALNFQPSTADFCRDMGTTLLAVATGDAAAIARIASVSGVSPSRLERAAFRRMDNRSLLHRGQKMTLHARSPQSIQYCASCLLRDWGHAEQDGHRRPEAFCFGRAHWICTQYRTCVEHGVALGSIPVRAYQQHDFVGAAWPMLADIGRIEASAARRTASELEAYIERRLSGRSNDYLDGLGFSVATRLCEMLGAVAMYGPWPPHLGFSDDQWHAAGAAGYDIVSQGPSAICSFLGSMKKVERDSREGAHSDWGILYNWMQDTRDPEIEPLLQLARDQIQSSYPVAEGQNVLGEMVKERRLHSIWSASIEHGVHVSVLRSQLLAAGVIEDAPDRHDNQILFPASENRQLLESVARGVSAIHARARINCERQILPVLVDAKILSPIVEVQSGYSLFDVAELDRFTAMLTADAVEYSVKPDWLASIPTAGKTIRRSQAEIVRLILDGRLSSVGRLKDVEGYASILVDPTEIAPLLRGKELGGIVITHIASDLGIPHAGLIQMLDKQLPTVERMHPQRRCMQRIVDRDVYANFKAEFVSLRDLSRAAGVNHRRHQAMLRARGIEPEPGLPKKVHLYRRSLLP